MIELLARSNDHAPSIERLVPPFGSQLSETVVLRRGRQIELVLLPAEGQTLPDTLEPLLYFGNHADRVRQFRMPQNRRNGSGPDFVLTPLTEIGAGRYLFRIGANAPPFFVGIHRRGFLRWFDAGAFDVSDLADHRLEIELPEAAAITIRFAPPNGIDEIPYRNVALDLMRPVLPGSNQMNTVARDHTTGRDGRNRLSIRDLAPGEYMAFVWATPGAPEAGTEINPGRFHDSKRVRLEAGATEEVDFRYVPPDPTAGSGDHSVTLRIQGGQSESAAQRSFALRFVDPHYGSQTVAEGKLDEMGTTLIDGLAAGSYTLSVDGSFVDQFSIEGSSQKHEKVFRLAPKAGDRAPDITVTDIETNKPLRLAELRGRVVYLEFWATWCGPCQKPMAELNDLWRTRRKDWEGRVTFLGVSVDESHDRLVQHLRHRDWLAIQQCWAKPANRGHGGFDSPAAQKYGLRSVPTALLIDQEGTIRWRGHPNELDLTNRVNELLNLE